jgi:NADH dehydrogenase
LSKLIFITGASGYIGRLLLSKILQEEPGWKYRVLARYPEEYSPPAQQDNTVEVVAGDLLRPETYAQALAGVDTVVHLAAVTGAKSRDDYFRVNQYGTARLVQCCRDAGVQRILHISTIAVKYPDISGYPYAQSKAAAEEIIKTGGIPFSIVRPTIVWGLGSPTYAKLNQLARPPALITFGRATAQIQPIFEADLVAFLILILRQQIFANETYDLGGPERLSFEAFLRQIYIGKTGTEPRFIIRVPVNLIYSGLSKIEQRGGDRLPVKSGQLSAFMFDSIAQENPLFASQKANMLDVRQMIMTTHSAAVNRNACTQLTREARLFGRYLVGQSPDEYIQDKYVQASTAISCLTTPLDGFDRFCLRVASMGTLGLPLADTYCTYFYKNATLRKKLVVMTAILENAGPTFRCFQSQRKRSFLAVMFSLGIIGLAAGFSLLLAGLSLGPLHLAASLLRKTKGGKT